MISFYKFLSLKIVISSFTLLCLFISFSSFAQADGGAPNLAYVAGTSAGISTIDIVQQKITGTIPLSGGPQTILLSLDGSLLYVTQPSINRVTFLATATKQSVCSIDIPGNPSLLALDSRAHLLYVGGHNSASVTALDTMNCIRKHTLQADSGIYGLALVASDTNGTGSDLWVADKASLRAFNSTGKLLTTLPVQEGPQYLSAPPGKTLYVTTKGNTVLAVDTSAYRLLPFSLHGGPFGPMDFDETTGEIYVPDLYYHQIDVLAPLNATASSQQEPARIIHLDSSPQSIAITSDGQLGFAALDNGDVVALDIPGRQILRTFHVGGAPRFIITGLYPSLLHFTPEQRTQVSVLDDLLHYAGIIAILLVGAFFLLKAKLGKNQQKSQ